MTKIKTFVATTGTPSFRGLEVETGIQKLIIKKTGAIFTNETISIAVHRDGKKIKDIAVNSEIIKLNAFAGFGAYNGVFNDSTLGATNDYRIIEISNNTYIFDNNTKLVIDFAGGVNTVSYDFQTDCTGTNSNLLCKYERGTITIGANSKVVDVSNQHFIAIDNNITRLTMLGDNGVSNNLDVEMLNVKDRLDKDFGSIGVNATAQVATDDNIYLKSVLDIQTVTIETDGSAVNVFHTLTLEAL